jgi:hypothetical protein
VQEAFNKKSKPPSTVARVARYNFPHFSANIYGNSRWLKNKRMSMLFILEGIEIA